ncbi:MAG: DUF2267 domain-containing protein [Chloroflexota bacterium]
MSNQAMTLQSFYVNVEDDARLRTPAHAERWTEAVLRTMGFNLGGGTKKDLANALPDELAHELKRGWKLINLHNPRLSQTDFLKEVARRSGNTDKAYARTATTAVFRNLKQFLDTDLTREVARSLPKDVATLWEEA